MRDLRKVVSMEWRSNHIGMLKNFLCYPGCSLQMGIVLIPVYYFSARNYPTDEKNSVCKCYTNLPKKGFFWYLLYYFLLVLNKNLLSIKLCNIWYGQHVFRDLDVFKKVNVYLFWQGNTFYIKPRVANTKFGIKHYAGEVRESFAIFAVLFAHRICPFKLWSLIFW